MKKAFMIACLVVGMIAFVGAIGAVGAYETGAICGGVAVIHAGLRLAIALACGVCASVLEDER